MTANPPKRSYNSIRIDGPISIQRVELARGVDQSNIILLLGPTGSGKSSLIEALAPKGSLQISSHLLEGCTQSISMYSVKNVNSLVYRTHEQIHIVDVPGFGDTKISEMSIVSMIKEWMQRMSFGHVGRILYFPPINVVRLPGSQRQMLKTFQTMTGVGTAENVIIVSTMWDLLSGECSTSRAERNFKQLRDVIWQDYIQEGSKLVRFENTLESVLSILDDACQALNSTYFHVEQSSLIREAAYGPDLYNNLQIRIQNLHIERTNIISELEGARLRSDAQLVKAVSLQLEETERLLAKFGKELEDFGPPPSPDLPADATVAPPALSVAPPALSHPPADTATFPDHPTPEKRGIVARAISSLMCCVQDVHEHHDL
ncbi:hypothetical protein BJ165DRAFT_1616428 [Panaeolus papilionaceus]|nr:hypothetical protein BJ165DRAFT_1616428 [Panaeolus papilionaceus]